MAEVAAGPPRFRSDGGYGAVAALAGSYAATLGWLVPSLLNYDELIFTILDSDCIYIALLVVMYLLFASWGCTRFASLHGVLPLSSS